MKIVLLLGPSSVGKTTLCNELAAKYQWKVINQDEFGGDAHKQAAEKLKGVAVQALNGTTLLNDLALYMSTEQVVHFGVTGELTLDKVVNPLNNHPLLKPQLPGLEEVLKTAGIDEKDIQMLAAKLREVTRLVEKNSVPVFNSPADFLTRFYDHALSQGKVDDTLVLDMFPLGNEKQSIILDVLNERVADFCNQHADHTVNIFTIFAYCPPQVLSARIDQRNSEAEANRDPRNMRKGLFPFYQLSQFMNGIGMQADEKQTQVEQNKWHVVAELTRQDVFTITSKHHRLPTNEDASVTTLELVDPIDPLALEPVTAEQENDLREIPLVAPKPMVREYRLLAEKFGFKNGDTRINLQLNPEIKFNNIVDMSTKDPQTLAYEIANEVASFDQPTITPVLIK